jgi:ABC-type glycerol-3-phosphate transport system substrate-binding protein
MVDRRQFLTGALLATVSVSACGPDETSSPGRLSFTYLRPTWGPATFTKDGPYEKELERRAKISVDVQIIPVVDYDTKVNTILASGDIPDVIWGSGPTSGTWKEAQDEGAFHPIDEYLERYPALRKIAPAEIWEQLKDDNGETFFVPNLIWPQVPFFTYYRKDLFDQAGISEPTTLEEFVAALDQAKTAYPDRIPFTIGYEWSTKELATSFGVAKNGWEPLPDDPSTLQPWFMKEKEVDLYFWLQDLHRRSLLDPDYGVNKEPIFATNKFKADKATVVIEHWGAYTDILTNVRKVAPDAEIGIMSPLGELGGSRQVFPVDRGFYVSARMADPDGFFEFLNWTLTDGTTFRRWGLPGKTFRRSGGKIVPIPDVGRENAYKGPQLEPLAFVGLFEEKLDWDVVALNFEAAGVSDQLDYVREKFDAYTAKEYPDYRDPTVLSPTETKQGSQLYQDFIQKIADSAIINHEVTRDDWAAAVEQWRTGGGQKIIEEVNSLQKDKSRPDYVQR